jgi:hypothetical protein
MSRGFAVGTEVAGAERRYVSTVLGGESTTVPSILTQGFRGVVSLMPGLALVPVTYEPELIR